MIPPSPILNQAVALVAAAFGLEPTEVVGRSKRRPVADARQMVMLLCDRAGMPQNELAWRFGMNQSSIYHAVLAGLDKLAVDRKLASLMRPIFAAMDLDPKRQKNACAS